VSPAARSSSPYFSSIIAVDTENTDVAFEAYTTGRLEAIVLDPATGGLHCLNGRTLSSSSAHYYVSVRRMANQIKTDIWFASQPLKSEPNNGTIIASLKNMVSSYLDNKAAIGHIKSATILSAVATGTTIRIDFQWYPIYPADQIDYGMHRLAVAV
jgi:phage tail sheath protein FI